MTELVVTLPQAEQRWRRVVVAVVLVAAIVVAAALFWPTGDRSEAATIGALDVRNVRHCRRASQTSADTEPTAQVTVGSPPPGCAK